jgi:hypothetical protein
VQSRSQIELPPQVGQRFEVYLNGVLQRPGLDFEQRGQLLCFAKELSQEGRLGFWRWLSLFLGVAGTYRKNDTVDVVYDDGGRRAVVTLQPETSSE